MKKLFEIIIPKSDNNGTEFTAEKYQQWGDTVLSYTTGFTQYPTCLGYWINPETKYPQIEEVIPVKIWCFKETIQAIAAFTKTHFEQKEVMFYELSEKVYMV